MRRFLIDSRTSQYMPGMIHMIPGTIQRSYYTKYEVPGTYTSYGTRYDTLCLYHTGIRVRGTSCLDGLVVIGMPPPPQTYYCCTCHCTWYSSRTGRITRGQQWPTNPDPTPTYSSPTNIEGFHQTSQAKKTNLSYHTRPSTQYSSCTGYVFSSLLAVLQSFVCRTVLHLVGAEAKEP